MAEESPRLPDPDRELIPAAAAQTAAPEGKPARSPRKERVWFAILVLTALMLGAALFFLAPQGFWSKLSAIGYSVCHQIRNALSSRTRISSLMRAAARACTWARCSAFCFTFSAAGSRVSPARAAGRSGASLSGLRVRRVEPFAQAFIPLTARTRPPTSSGLSLVSELASASGQCSVRSLTNPSGQTLSPAPPWTASRACWACWRRRAARMGGLCGPGLAESAAGGAFSPGSGLCAHAGIHGTRRDAARAREPAQKLVGTARPAYAGVCAALAQILLLDVLRLLLTGPGAPLNL
jgi:hypothetical protein